MNFCRFFMSLPWNFSFILVVAWISFVSLLDVVSYHYAASFSSIAVAKKIVSLCCYWNLELSLP